MRRRTCNSHRRSREPGSSHAPTGGPHRCKNWTNRWLTCGRSCDSLAPSQSVTGSGVRMCSSVGPISITMRVIWKANTYGMLVGCDKHRVVFFFSLSLSHKRRWLTHIQSGQVRKVRTLGRETIQLIHRILAELIPHEHTAWHKLDSKVRVCVALAAWLPGCWVARHSYSRTTASLTLADQRIMSDSMCLVMLSNDRMPWLSTV